MASVLNCSQITSQWSHMVFVNDPDACMRHKTQRWRHIGSFFFFSYQTYSIHFALSHFRYASQWLLKKKGHKGTGRQACHQYSCHLWHLLWATTEQIHVKVKCFFSKSLQQTHHLGKKKIELHAPFSLSLKSFLLTSSPFYSCFSQFSVRLLISSHCAV